MRRDADGKQRCIFCGQAEGPFHKEDVFPKWIAKELGVPYVEVRPVDGAQKPYGAKRHLGLVSRAICQECNNGWMSALEEDAKPLLSPLFRGRPCALDPANQVVVARWLLKTAMTHDAIKQARYFRPGDYQRFYESRTIPRDTLMYLARAHFPHPGIKSRSYPLPLLVAENTPEARPIDGYAATFAINRLALQIFALRRPEEFDGLFKLSLPDNWDSAVLRVWPAAPLAIHWPPIMAFDEAGFEDFSQRWFTLKL